ncbi:hypothetical protein D3870_12255 [Noviherbaspirillum cavernae]|uniref:HTH luxR-type domain-containing protein n=1 Tax=Noviherbaspirillum cavernae TaxID=2320862 RepID=A0A418X2I3_9BURK|nr:LuxR C-terminal-related transcriptional regulator [Noviherbaspirillum cavernae]RJG06678.1 hypothetical protein D3870_12255 [Noviherbaspirillum cavernae]
MESYKLLALVQSGHAIETLEEFKAWVSGPLKDYFPHDMMLCAQGHMMSDEIHIKHLIAINYPEHFVSHLAKSMTLSVKDRIVLQRWLLESRAQIVDTPDAISKLSKLEQAEFAMLGRTNMAVYGCIDITGQAGSYFSFSNIPGSLTESHRCQLELIVPYLHQLLIRIHHQQRKKSDLPRSASIRLTERETQILQLMAAGMSNRAIAEMLSRSELTIQNHVHAILKKMGVPNRAAAVGAIPSISEISAPYS